MKFPKHKPYGENLYINFVSELKVIVSKRQQTDDRLREDSLKVQHSYENLSKPKQCRMEISMENFSVPRPNPSQFF